MQSFQPTRVSVSCPCGGRHSNIPENKQRHANTYKHTTWLFESLCAEFLTLSEQRDRVKYLVQMRDILRTGRVKD